ncbi:hypothetical protein B0H13DRAFT_1918496 [Mycena leptocephala]|nr:hypothetical protein B0H13DRAFT_1918496 [Mycena leptocephala]
MWRRLCCVHHESHRGVTANQVRKMRTQKMYKGAPKMRNTRKEGSGGWGKAIFVEESETKDKQRRNEENRRGWEARKILDVEPVLQAASVTTVTLLENNAQENGGANKKDLYGGAEVQHEDPYSEAGVEEGYQEIRATRPRHRKEDLRQLLCTEIDPTDEGWRRGVPAEIVEGRNVIRELSAEAYENPPYPWNPNSRRSPGREFRGLCIYDAKGNEVNLGRR